MPRSFWAKTTAHYAYPREELVREDIFPYLVLDGGISQLTLDRFTANSSARLLEHTMSGKLFEERKSGGGYVPRASEVARSAEDRVDTVKINMNMRGIYPDGASDEASPSYSYFIVRLYLEAYL